MKALISTFISEKAPSGFSVFCVFYNLYGCTPMSQLEKSSDQSCAGGQCWPLPGDHVTRDQYLAISRFIRRNILFIILFTIEYLQSLAPHIWPADTDHGADSIKGLIIWLRCWWEWQIYMMDSETQKLR